MGRKRTNEGTGGSGDEDAAYPQGIKTSVSVLSASRSGDFGLCFLCVSSD